MTIPQDLNYTKEHEWVRVADGVATVGITAFAAEALGDVVFVELPEAGSSVSTGTVCGEIESTKSVSELYAPVDGDITDVNQAVIDNPEIVNSDPYEQGWLFRVRVDSAPELLDAAAYAALTQEA